MILVQKCNLLLEKKYDNFLSSEKTIQYCKDLLPIVEKLDGEMSVLKWKIAYILAVAEINVRKAKLKEKQVSPENLLKELKPYIWLQLEAKKHIF